jgi:hypothetical protein
MLELLGVRASPPLPGAPTRAPHLEQVDRGEGADAACLGTAIGWHHRLESYPNSCSRVSSHE